MSSVLGRFGKGVSMWCPGCRCDHNIPLKEFGAKGRPIWKWDGDKEKPTFAPSILVTWTDGEGRKKRRCHSFIRKGQWQFLKDCTHELAGQTVDMVASNG